MDAETTSRGAGAGPEAAGTDLEGAGKDLEGAVEAPKTDSRNVQTARIWERIAVRPSANAWRESESAWTSSTSASRG